VDVEILNQNFLEIGVPDATFNIYLNTQPLCDTSSTLMCINQSDVPAGILHAVGLDNISPKFDKLFSCLILLIFL